MKNHSIFIARRGEEGWMIFCGGGGLKVFKGEGVSVIANNV